MKKLLLVAVAFPALASAQVPTEFSEYEAATAAAAVYAKHCRAEISTHGRFLERCDEYADYLEKFSAIHETYIITIEDEDFNKMLNETVSTPRWNQHIRNVESLERDFRFIDQMLK